ncbi:DUF4271 domain-containing protein [Cecembia calidifontis]|uniref:Uncharacterized protein DUF4271 n=1 Tax=Cecembia calidifontis TaxID=1187080 RepID=A0A4Q7P6A5_9BACT|nr:DUF4271 domain-containing protein [Cecembia calidifontis]RZS95038.1 uncharacterized protein DUF4271 [Cecembia calidifontis]
MPRLIFFLLMFSLNHVLQAQVLENYQSNILYTKNKSIFNKYHSAQLEVNLQDFPASSLFFEIPQGSTVFLEGKLWVFAERDTVITVALSQLKETFVPADPSKVKVAVLNDDASLEGFHVLKGYFGERSQDILESSPSVFDWEQRKVDDFDDFFILATIILLFLVSIFKVVFPNVLDLIIRPQTVISADDFSESGSIQKFFTLDVLFYIFMVNLGISLLVLLYVHIAGVSVFLDLGNSDINNLFLIWFLLSIGLAILSVFKFLFLKVMVYLFDLSKFDFAHFFYLLRIISISVLGMLILSIFFFFNNHSVLVNFFQIALKSFFWVYLFGVFFMFLIMVNRVPFKNYHLFAYICSAELIPFLIIAKLVMG